MVVILATGWHHLPKDVDIAIDTNVHPQHAVLNNLERPTVSQTHMNIFCSDTLKVKQFSCNISPLCLNSFEVDNSQIHRLI